MRFGIRWHQSDSFLHRHAMHLPAVVGSIALRQAVFQQKPLRGKRATSARTACSALAKRWRASSVWTLSICLADGPAPMMAEDRLELRRSGGMLWRGRRSHIVHIVPNES